MVGGGKAANLEKEMHYIAVAVGEVIAEAVAVAIADVLYLFLNFSMSRFHEICCLQCLYYWVP